MTGTAETEANEFHDIYKLDVDVIPTNRPVARKDSTIASTRRGAKNSTRSSTRSRTAHAREQPVLVGTVSVEASELLSRMLKREKIPHTVLNAKYPHAGSGDRRPRRPAGHGHDLHQHGGPRHRH